MVQETKLSANMPERPVPSRRLTAQEATIATFYRHACADAAAAASMQDWAECTRLMEIARSIEESYPAFSARARFAPSRRQTSAD